MIEKRNHCALSTFPELLLSCQHYSCNICAISTISQWAKKKNECARSFPGHDCYSGTSELQCIKFSFGQKFLSKS